MCNQWLRQDTNRAQPSVAPASTRRRRPRAGDRLPRRCRIRVEEPHCLESRRAGARLLPRIPMQGAASANTTDRPAVAGLPERLIALLLGFIPAQLAFVMARLRLAELLAHGGMALDELSSGAGTHPGMMRRLVRGLAGLGLVELEGDDRVSLTELGAQFGAGVPGSVRDLALHRGGRPTRPGASSSTRCEPASRRSRRPTESPSSAICARTPKRAPPSTERRRGSRRA
jgi:hypothetical protein